MLRYQDLEQQSPVKRRFRSLRFHDRILPMTAADIQSFIAAGESLTVEFKGEERTSLSDREIYEAVVCLANTDGGVIIIGVEDDRRITGARPRHGKTTD